MTNFGECERTVTDPLIVLEDKRCKCKLTFLNPNRLKVRRVHLDDVIKDGLRCDHLLIDQKRVEHYVELKGCDVRHALLQIEATISATQVRQVLGDSGERRAFLISTRYPRASGRVQKHQIRFKEDLRTTLVVCKRQHRENI